MAKMQYHITEEGNKKYLIIDCEACSGSKTIADDPDCMAAVIDLLTKEQADLIILTGIYERLYDEKQTAMLKDLAAAAHKLESEKVWAYENLVGEDKSCDKFASERHDTLVRIAYELIKSDPIQAYLATLAAQKREKTKIAAQGRAYEQCTLPYLKTLSFVQQVLESTMLIQSARPFFAKLQQYPGRVLYHTFFEAQIKPSFIGSRLLYGETANLELIDQYIVEGAPVQIFASSEKLEKLYFVNPPEYTLPPEKYFVLTKTKEIVASYRPRNSEVAAATTSREYFERIYESTIEDVARESNVKLTQKEKADLARLVARYTVGYGTLELLLLDRQITDIYLDAPLGSAPVYLVHSKYEQCQTNIMYTETEAKALVSRFRAMSGRPFDEAHPILDYDLPDMHARLAVIGPPLSPYGIAFVFRLHKETPWTLPQELDFKMMPPLVAGALSFFIDAQASSLIVGSRGAGKTSLMSALMLEIPQNLRILVQEDTLELPIPEMKRVGFNIQRMKTRSAIGASATSTEVSPEDALRTALRLGDSVLIVGEVRSKEAKVLYEAMRVGAVGNVVMGTIHGENAYSVWDRVVNDLGVPTTSFKATDLVITAAPVRFGGGLKRYRRLLEITEIGKDWTEDPKKEGGLLDLFTFNGKKDDMDFHEDNWQNSRFLKRVCRLRGITMDDIWEEIQTRATTKNYLVQVKRQFDIPELLEAKYTVPAQNKLLLIEEQHRQKYGGIERKELLAEWKKWVDDTMAKPLIAAKKRREASATSQA